MSLSQRMLVAMNSYLNGRNKAESMILAGYSKSTAYDHPERLFEHPEFKKELQKRQDKMFKKTDITVEYILEHLKKIVDDTETSPANRMRALEALMKHLGMMTEKVDVHIKDDIVNRIQSGRERMAPRPVEED